MKIATENISKLVVVVVVYFILSRLLYLAKIFTVVYTDQSNSTCKRLTFYNQLISLDCPTHIT